MAKEKIEALVEGGKASAAPPLGPALGPMGVNIGEVIAEINKKTDAFKGMKVPVKVIVDADSKEFEIEVGTPPVSQLLKKELGLDKGSGMPDKNFVGNAGIEQIIKVAKMKLDSLLVKDFKSAVKTVIGSCNAIGVLVEGLRASEASKAVEDGKWAKEIKEEKTEIAQEKKNELKAQLKEAQEEMAKELERIKEEEEAEKAEEEAKEGEEKKEEAKEGEEKKEEGKEGEKKEGEKKEKKEEKKEEKKK